MIRKKNLIKRERECWAHVSESNLYIRGISLYITDNFHSKDDALFNAYIVNGCLLMQQDQGPCFLSHFVQHSFPNLLKKLNWESPNPSLYLILENDHELYPGVPPWASSLQWALKYSSVSVPSSVSLSFPSVVLDPLLPYLCDHKYKTHQRCWSCRRWWGIDIGEEGYQGLCVRPDKTFHAGSPLGAGSVLGFLLLEVLITLTGCPWLQHIWQYGQIPKDWGV